MKIPPAPATPLHLIPRLAGRPSARRRVCLWLPALSLATLAWTSAARAVTPAPVGGYANYNTATGDSALYSLDGGFANTAVGYQALYNDTTGDENTACGGGSLQSNSTGSNNTASGYEALLPTPRVATTRPAGSGVV